MTVLVFGSTGQVASALKMTLADQGAVFLDRGACDLGSPAAVQAALERYQPRFIINAAAYTAVDRAEEEPELAYAINAVAPRIMAEYVASVSSGGRLNPPPSSLIHISTDFVFNGTRTTPYRPGDPTDPLGAYGASKLAGELNILDAAPERSMIIRTAWVYHEEGGNFVKTMLRLMGERNELGVVNDQRGSPTYAASIADAITTIIQQDLFTPGIYHWTDAGDITWYEFAAAIQEEALELGLLDQAIPVNPITTDDYPTPAERPAYSVLDCTKLTRLTGLEPVPWRDNLRNMLITLSS